MTYEDWEVVNTGEIWWTSYKSQLIVHTTPIKSGVAGTAGPYGELLIANLQTCWRALQASLSSLSVAAPIAFLGAVSSVTSFSRHRGAIARNKT